MPLPRHRRPSPGPRAGEGFVRRTPTVPGPQPPAAPAPAARLPGGSVTWLDPAAFAVAEEARRALGQKRGSDPEWLRANGTDYGWARLEEITGPMPMHFAPWYFDPSDPGDRPKRDVALKAIADGTFGKQHYYLSRFYWSQWSDKRPPILVICPDGSHWCVDAVSSNGEGWTVTGTPPKITCSPSIAVSGYHGYLKDGVFTPGL